MKFAAVTIRADFEQRLARWSIGLLGGSLLLLGAFLAFALTVAASSKWAFAAAACLLLYAFMAYLLGSIHKRSRAHRLRIWQTSLVGHVLLLVTCSLTLGSFSLAFVLLLPEIASGALHLVAIQHLSCAARDA